MPVKFHVARAGEKITPEVSKIIGIPEGTTSKVNIIAFEIESGILKPDELPQVQKDVEEKVAPRIKTSEPTIITGRGPHWLYATIEHEVHYTRILATWEPRLGKGIIIEAPSKILFGKGIDIDGTIEDVELGAMGTPSIDVEEYPDRTILSVKIEGDRFIEPKLMSMIHYPDVPTTKPLIISGLMPIWLGGRLVTEYMHRVPALAIYDPRIGAGIIVASHDPKYKVGQHIKLTPDSPPVPTPA